MGDLGCECDSIFDFAQCPVLFQQVGDVHAGADVAAEVPARPITRRALVGNPAIFSVVPLQAVLHYEWLTRIECAAISLQGVFSIIWMNAFTPAVIKVLLHASTGELEPRLVDESAKLVRSPSSRSGPGAASAMVQNALRSPLTNLLRADV